MIEVRLPLTSAQLGVWTAEQVTPGADAFRISQLIWLDGEIDTPLLERAIDVAISEADVLGLRPVEDADGLPVLRRTSGAVGTTTVVEVAQPDNRIRAEAWTRCHEFGAGDDRFESMSVIHRRAEGWAWEFATHHLFLDAYGLGLVTRRVGEVYTALVDNEEIPPRWFGAYSELAEAGAANVDDHWLQRFEAVDDITPITFDASRQFFLTDARTHVTISATVAESIDQLARTARVTWSDVVALGWGLYTAALVGRDAFAVRLPQMNRSGRPALTTPAMLVGAAPVVFRPSPSATVRELLQQVSSEVRTAARHTVAGEKLARMWPNGPDDYQAIPQLNIKAFDYNQSFGPIRGRQETIASGPVGFLDLMAYRDSIHGFLLDVATSDPAMAASGVIDTANGFVQFLGRLAADPEARIASLRVVDADVAFSSGPVVSVADSTLDALIQRRVAGSVGAVAIIDDGGVKWSYADFDARVNALAHVLIEHGVQVGDRVAVQLPRSVDLVTALFAVIRVGAAYVPIDPEYPAERITHILDDAAPALVVTLEFLDDPTVAARLTQGKSAAPVLARALTPADTAYVIFTSGTTGRPKGVAISHRAIVNRLSWMATDYRIGAGDRILQKTPSVFDVSVWEFFLPAVVGATLVVAKDGGHKDPDYLADIIDRHRITVLHFVPAMLAAFLTSAPDPHRLTSVRRVFSGEALPAPNAAAADRLFAEAELHNLYGPTEAAVDVTAEPVHAHALDGAVTVPIGVPVANTVTRVLDTWLRPVPVGVTGELYLGGIQLADGYLARPDLTATRFIADPTTDSGQRLYRTGDLVRWNTDGHLDYLGRSDDQVKIRGFRIELDDIRTVLEHHPAVSTAIVTAVDHPNGTGTYLAAYHTGTGHR
ncbi:amino acid adenylation domain-containing protein [Rhodococcus sp. P1Y]|uniref:amino acid adenylation domain-containing protein n=1 Tax=Rhodococcus sp. P1Y TaxID=1302308 RepID=UPI00129384F1|nr:amino acid adenylation domain-containing protein [Rhodococcus sp. P1Y]